MPPTQPRPTSAPSSARDKPYRRGRTLGKDSLRGRTPRVFDEKERSGGKRRTAAGGTGRRGRGSGGVEQAGEEAEWGGIESGDQDGEDDDEEMDGPSAREGAVAPPPAAAAAGPPGKGKKERRKTGGTGKKAKTFVEGKDALLSLAASITGTQEAKKQEKLERGKQRLAKPARPTESQEPSAAKQNQLAAARAIVAERAKQKKDRQKADAAPPKPAAAGEGKKRVSFA
ncbi:hypothetical protein JCM21900_000112 [Sporobolomyces salmonicolor]